MTERLISFGRICFAVSLIAFGILQFVFDDYIVGRAPAWPWGETTGFIWAYVTAVIFIATGFAIVRNRRVRLFAVSAGLIVFLWAFLRQIPPALADPSFGSTWTHLGKAMVLTGGMFAIAGISPSDRAFPRSLSFLNTGERFINMGRITLGLFMVLTGIQHFLFPSFVAILVPLWIPGAVFWTYFAGMALVAGGVGLLIPQTTWLSAPLSGLMIFLWVLILHIPLALGAEGVGNEWIAVFEALALSGLAFILAGLFLKKRRS